MRYVLITLIPLIGVVFGCNSMDATRTTSSPNVAKPAKAIQSDTEAIDSEAGAIQDRSNDVAVNRSAATIQAKSGHIRDLAGQIERTQPQIADLRQTVKREKREDTRAASHIWLWLQVAGVVIAGLGIAAAVYLHRPALAIGCGLGGMGVAAAARLWQEYWWILVLALGVILTGALVYVVWWAGQHRKALMRQLFGYSQDGEGAKILNEAQQAGEKTRQKQ